MKKYCASCGGGTEYSTTPPNYCGKCGIEYKSVFASEQPKPKETIKLPSKHKRVIVERYEEEDEEEDDDYEITSSRRNKLSVSFDIEEMRKDIEADVKPRRGGVKLGEALGSTPGAPVDKKAPIKGYNKKKAIKELQQLATPNNTPIDIN